MSKLLKKTDGKLTRDQQARRYALVMLLPALIFLACLIAYPLGKVLHDAFSHVHLINKSMTGFAGLDNFKKVVSDEHFAQAIRNTIFWTVFSVAGEYIMGMLTAVLLNQKFKGRAIFRTLVFIPWLVPIIVAGMTWDWMLNPDFGIINYLLLKVGLISEKINFLGDSRYAMATVIFVNIWRSFPYYTISFLSAMQSIPADLNEAAAVDGAGRFKRIWHVTLPGIRTTVALLAILSLGNILNAGFDQIYNLYNPLVYSTGDIIDTWVYRAGLQNLQYSLATAVGLFKSVISVILIALGYRLADKFTGYKLF